MDCRRHFNLRFGLRFGQRPNLRRGPRDFQPVQHHSSLRFGAIATMVVVLSPVVRLAKAEARALDMLPPQEVERRMGELRHLKMRAPPLEKQDGEHGDCLRSRVSLQVTDPKLLSFSRTYDLTVVRPAHIEGPVPVMILVPTIEGTTAVENKIAANFCDMNVATIIADVDDNSAPKEYPAWGLEDSRNRMAIFALRTIIDYAKSNQNFNPDKVGMMGSSLGGIMTSFIAGLEGDRLAAIVSVVGGGNLPFIESLSDNGRIAEIREARMKYERMSKPEEYENKLRQTVRYDPMYFAFNGRTDRILMVISTSDHKVPTEAQFELHRAFGKPRDSKFKVGHIPTILGIAYMYFDTVGKFLKEKMALPGFYRPFTPSEPPDEAREELQCLL